MPWSHGIRELARLRKRYGRGRWRKRKGVARVRLPSGEIVRAEPKELVICVKNEDYPVSLELRKLYPRELFIAIELPQPIRRRVLQAA